MVATVIFKQDKNGDMFDLDGHLRNTTGQKLDAQGNVIPDADATGAAQPVEEAAPPKALAEYNRPDEYYTNISAICLPEIQKENFELKPQYYTLVSQLPYSGLPHEHPMNHLERFEDLIAAIRMDRVLEDYILCKLFKYTLTREAMHWLKKLPTQDL
ncbi:uncharacterized protein LOC125609546 [Brassica napus]|uniref:uncharacterized protein LOC125609546 n=1 Tax=Brassica napus TaxID=3708 RepID=UPI0020787700|nr:uncharacterized protein LOC125609546 [Brassica napus]